MPLDFKSNNFLSENLEGGIKNPQETVINNSFFVLLKPNCYYEDGVVQTDFVAYNIPLESLNLTDEVLYKLNVCPSKVFQNFQTLESQIHTIKPLIEQETA